MIKKQNGFLSLPGGEVLDCDIELDEHPVPIKADTVHDGEAMPALAEMIKQAVRTFQIPPMLVGMHDGPTGPVVDCDIETPATPVHDAEIVPADKVGMIQRMKPLLDQGKIVFPAQPLPTQELDDFSWGLNEMVKKFQIPTGPIVESTLAQKDEDLNVE